MTEEEVIHRLRDEAKGYFDGICWRRSDFAVAALALIDRLRLEAADRDNAEMHGLRSALTAMTAASAISAIEDEYDFGPAITEVRTLLGATHSSGYCQNKS